MVWGCMGWNGVGKLIEVQGKMNADKYCEILDEGVAESFESLDFPEDEQIFQQDNDPKHTFKKAKRRQRSGSRTITFNFLIGLPSPLILNPLNTFGSTSSVNFNGMIPHLKVCMSGGTEWWRNGMRYHQRYAKG